MAHATQARHLKTNTQSSRAANSPKPQPVRDKTASPHHQRNPALDGLRALAILAVIAYHLRVPWLPSGHLGVLLFFVLTGYLVTRSLGRSYDGGHIRIVHFWTRRLGRIWPSMAWLVAITVALCAAVNHVLLTKARPDVLPSLILCSNLSQIARGASYFDQIGGPSPLAHLWYLGVDAQFCLVWPLILWILLHLGRPAARRITFVLALASAIWMALLYVPGADPTRVYYGPDTRAFAPLLGAWLALRQPFGQPVTTDNRFASSGAGRGTSQSPNATSKPDLAPSTKGSSAIWHLAGLLSLVTIVAAMVLLDDTSDILYRGGMFVVALLACLLLAALLHRDSIASRLLGLGPLAWLGRRSYGLYLWHVPVIALANAGAGATWQVNVAALAASFMLAELSHQLFERKELARITESNKPVLVTLSLAAIAICAWDIWAYVTIPDESLVPRDAIVNTGASAGAAADLSASSGSSASASSSDTSTSSAASAITSGRDSKSSSSAASADLDSYDLSDLSSAPKRLSAPANEVSTKVHDPVLIGDSVPGALTSFSDVFPNGYLDSYVGRRPLQAIDVAKGYADQSVLGHIVIFACFSNTTPWPDQLDSLVKTCGDREIYLVGTVNSQGFMDAADDNLKDCAKKYDNVHYVDWPSVCKGHEADYLYDDGIHLRPDGAAAYQAMISIAVAPAIRAEGGTIS